MYPIGKCPLCGQQYFGNAVKKTHHHVLPKLWYHGKGPLVEVCSVCHQEFNHSNPMDFDNRWSKKDCIWRWIRFCKSKGKNALEVYPEIVEEILG